ncbi:hypothetical protein KY284_008855 [Solanum tuberosum]|nr:hypothetical protein KY284_008855 [Solanum tuberosum]
MSSIASDPCYYDMGGPRQGSRVLHWVGGLNRKGYAHSEEIPTQYIGKIEEGGSIDLVLDDGYNLNYITSEVVAYLGLPRLQRTYPYTMRGCKVTEGAKVAFTRIKYYEEVWCDIMPRASCHLSFGANSFTEHRVPKEQNGYKCVVDHWGTPLFPLPKLKSERQKIEWSKGKQGGNLRVEK